MNNTLHGEVTLPRLATSLAIDPLTITAGETLTMQVNLENLQSSVTLPLTASLRIISPIDGDLYEEIWTLTLDGGEQRYLETEWASSQSSKVGLYLVESEVTDAYGERHLHWSFFTMQDRPLNIQQMTQLNGTGSLVMEIT